MENDRAVDSFQLHLLFLFFFFFPFFCEQTQRSEGNLLFKIKYDTKVAFVF